jgi:general secretion pathway protein F
VPIYSYRAVDARESAIAGTIAADTPRKARDQLRGRGLFVQNLEVHVGRKSAFAGIWRRRARSATVAVTIREIATLLSVGITLVDALDTLTKQYRGNLHTWMLSLRDRVSAGASFSEAASELPELFDELSVRMLEVGEASGNLDTVLHRLADFKERSAEFKDRVIGALLYPAIVLLTSMIVTGFLMMVVMPMLLDQLVEAGRTLPWPTRVLKGISDLLTQSGHWIALGLIIVTAALVVILRTEPGRRFSGLVALKIPVVGNMVVKQNISRIAYIMSALLGTGVDFVKAAEIAARSTRSLIYRESLLAASRLIHAGQEIGPALGQTGAFPPMVVQVFTVGQASGQLDSMLERLAESYDRQLATLSSRIATVVEPVMILFLAVVVGFILFATILPILEAGHVV